MGGVWEKAGMTNAPKLNLPSLESLDIVQAACSFLRV